METQSVKACKVEGCKRPYRAKGYCQIHFRKWRRGEMPKRPRYKTCGEENCKKPMVRWGLCEAHYQVLLAAKKGTASAAEPAPKEEAPKEESKKE